MACSVSHRTGGTLSPAVPTGDGSAPGSSDRSGPWPPVAAQSPGSSSFGHRFVCRCGCVLCRRLVDVPARGRWRRCPSLVPGIGVESVITARRAAGSLSGWNGRLQRIAGSCAVRRRTGIRLSYGSPAGVSAVSVGRTLLCHQMIDPGGLAGGASHRWGRWFNRFRFLARRNKGGDPASHACPSPTRILASADRCREPCGGAFNYRALRCSGMTDFAVAINPGSTNPHQPKS